MPMRPDTKERTPLLQSPAAVSQHHRLGPPVIRFPCQSVRPGFAQQTSYGFPGVRPTNGNGRGSASSSNHSDAATLIGGTGEQAEGGRAARAGRAPPRREDSKVYTSFPRSDSTIWEARTPEEAEPNFFSRLLAKKQTSSSQDHPDLEAYGSQRPGLPKVSRQCLWSEFKCYGYYISFGIPFVFLALFLGLLVYFLRSR